LDRDAIERQGVSGYELMQRAAAAALRVLRSRWPKAQRIGIVCGAGNNGGDGLVLARLAQSAGLKVAVRCVGDFTQLKAEAAEAWADFSSLGIDCADWATPWPDLLDLLVDAYLGIGFKAPLRDPARAVIGAINAYPAPVFALDVPSGLDSDSGESLAAVVRAEATLCFLLLKSGLFLGRGPEYTGQLFFDDLGIPVPESAAFQPRLTRLHEAEIAAALPRRAREAHKGQAGRVLVIGGGPGMSGAAQLSAAAALRTGAGLVQVACAPSSALAVSAGVPELMVQGVEDPAAIAALVTAADVVALGPGLGQSDWSRALWRACVGAALHANKPLVLDADALNALAREFESLRSEAAIAPALTASWVLTPHPGEAARLLGSSATQVQADRLAALQALRERYGGVVVLKGAGTLVATPGLSPAICEYGNPGMATAGTGDVLTGVIAGVLAQTRNAGVAARVGVLVHALAGDAAARAGERGLIASDLIRELRQLVNWS
jgi:NAD(P)H-hydrate epimerase